MILQTKLQNKVTHYMYHVLYNNILHRIDNLNYIIHIGQIHMSTSEHEYMNTYETLT